MQPTYLKCIRDANARGRALEIGYSENTPAILDSLTLRTNCPCAKCIEERARKSSIKSKLKIIKSTIEESSSIKEIRAVGNYAINIVWNDGHDTGIYTFKFLEELANHNSLLPPKK